MKNKYFYGLPQWLTFLLLLMAARHLPAQKHGYNWLFGGRENNGICNMLDFRQNPPAISTFQTHPVEINQYATPSAFMNDSFGNFLFYTNYSGVWNNKGRIPGSKNLEVGPPFLNHYGIDQVLILPLPGATNQYAIISRGTPSVLTSLYCSVVEPLANNGSGRIVLANKVLLDTILFGETQVCKHGNGRDWWIIVPDMRLQFGFWLFLLDPSGIKGPFRYDSMENCSSLSGFTSYTSSGISPDGHWLVRRRCSDSIGIYAFDRCSGGISLHRSIPAENLSHYENINYIFSPDQRFLYVISGLEIYSIDLSVPELPSLPNEQLLVSVGNLDSDLSKDIQVFGRPLAGPDGKIYILQKAFGLRNFFYVMHRPNLPGLAIDIAYQGLEWIKPSIDDGSVFIPNYQLGKWEGSPCDTMGRHPADGGFQKTSYKAFLERQAKGVPEASHTQPPMLPINESGRKTPLPDRLEHRINVSKSTFPDHEK